MGGRGRIGMRYIGPRLMHGPVARYTDNEMAPITYQRIASPHWATHQIKGLHSSLHPKSNRQHLHEQTNGPDAQMCMRVTTSLAF